MKRDALRTFIARAILAALPLGLGNPAQAQSCGEIVIPDGGAPSQYQLNAQVCLHICGTSNCTRVPTDGGYGILCECSSRVVCGRRTDGVAMPDARGANAVGAFFAGAAQLEAASVPAFARLARELRAHGAPPSLIARAERARRDEIRHARAMAKLARRFGGAPRAIAKAALPVRSLAEIAVENAAEGCVRESLGALVAEWQARFAADARVRAAMKRIATDEREHAELAWDVARFLGLRVDLRDAIAALDVSEPDREVAAIAGLPSSEVMQSFVKSARRELWCC
jgi:hypothetical protein